MRNPQQLKNLRELISKFYQLDVYEIHLHREMIGLVYFLRNDAQRYVFKLFRPFHTQQALQSIEIIEYLAHHDYPVVRIVATPQGNQFVSIQDSIGVLYEFIEGTEPDIKKDLVQLGQHVALLHQLMEHYPNPLIQRGKPFYIDRYISLLSDLNYDNNKIKDLQQYANQLWQRMEKLPSGFCHGDLHSGNILLTPKQEYILFDFDVAGRAYSMIDISTLCDATHFNHLDASMYDATMIYFSQFYQGYSKVRTLQSLEIRAIVDWVAIRHYELIATITECEDDKQLYVSFLDQQHHWLMSWQQLCQNKF